MGQYYIAVFLGEDKNGKANILGSVEPHDCSPTSQAKLYEHAYVGDPVMECVQGLLERGKGQFAGSRLVWAGDYADHEPGYDENLNALCDEKGIKDLKPVSLKYAINETKKLYIDLEDIRGRWPIHPIPLLCVEDDGDATVEFESEDTPEEKIRVGTWARDVITFSDERPTGKGWKKVKYNFKHYGY